MHKSPYSAGIWNLNIIMLASMFVVRAMNRPTRYMLKAHVIVSSFILLISSLFLAADGGECKKWVGGEFMPANKLKLLLLKCAMCFFGEVGHFSLPGHRLVRCVLQHGCKWTTLARLCERDGVLFQANIWKIILFLFITVIMIWSTFWTSFFLLWI